MNFGGLVISDIDFASNYFLWELVLNGEMLSRWKDTSASIMNV